MTFCFGNPRLLFRKTTATFSVILPYSFGMIHLYFRQTSSLFPVNMTTYDFGKLPPTNSENHLCSGLQFRETCTYVFGESHPTYGETDIYLPGKPTPTKSGNLCA